MEGAENAAKPGAWRKLALSASVAGIIFVVLYVTSFYLLSRIPPGSATDGQTLTLAGLLIVPYSGLAFLYVMIMLRAMGRATGIRFSRILGQAQFGAGLIFIAFVFAAVAALAATPASMQYAGLQADPVAVRILPLYSSTLLVMFAMRMAAMFVFTTTSIGWATQLMPSWFRWLSYLDEVRIVRTSVKRSFEEPWYNTASMLLQPKWHVAPPAPSSFLQSIPEHPLLAQVLFNRGLTTPAEVSAFLNGADAAAVNPYKLKDMAPAVQRILAAIKRGETICVYGDFDVDGVSSTALLAMALQLAGGAVGPYIPDRVDEGYGLNTDAITRIAAKAKLLVTVDCGIRSIEEVAHARALGMDVIVTDHHTVGPDLPPALAVINPRRADCPAKAEQLAGVGVAFRLAQAVLRAVANDSSFTSRRFTADSVGEVEDSLIDLVALGTVADVMPLLGQNRALVRRGLQKLNREPRPGLEALMRVADLAKGGVDSTAIAFRLAPRLNAAGRLAKAKLAYDLLRTADATNADLQAKTLEDLNRMRRRLTDQAQTEAETQLAAELGDDPPLLMAASPHFEHGIVGLVAGKLAEQFYRPAIVLREEAETARGSARSIPEFDISRALDQVDGLLIRHGGHPLAAGFTVLAANVAPLRAALTELAAAELGDRRTLRPTLEIDAEVHLEDINHGVVQQFARLEPTGEGNPQPLLLARGARVRSVNTVGQGKHLKLGLDSGPATHVHDAIGFRLGEWKDTLREGHRVDVVFGAELNEWQGQRRLQLNLQDVRLAQ
jgi:single-stranded-DNA-specific exonuclease